MKVTKDGVTKDVSENVVSIYENMGWKVVKVNKEVKKTPITPPNSNFGLDNK